MQNVMTEKGARTMALDDKTHTVFLSTAKLGPPPAPTPQNPYPPKPSHGFSWTFKMLVIHPDRKH